MVTIPGGNVLDPFNGSGGTALACIKDKYKYTGIEMNPEYCEITKTRVEGWKKHLRDGK